MNVTGVMYKEVSRRTLPGIPMALFLVLLLLGSFIGFVATLARSKEGAEGPDPTMVVFTLTIFVVSIFLLPGLFGVQPNQAVVLTLFGKYAGTVREQGLRWVNPFLSKKRLSMRVRNFETAHLKVNDLSLIHI